ncbi:MAG: DUF2892 domain-containing protein [Chloroflexi bacterium]|nr:DUF2892 domain-containing protein [Chloroflexota bacterium]
MFYPKNVPNMERIFRLVLGIALLGITFLTDQAPIGAGLLIFSALFVMVTAFVGWCPACAMMGRKIGSKSQNRG